MEADWEVEIGGEAAVIEAVWPGFVDLRRDPCLAAQLPEAVQLPALAEALATLNGTTSPVWTSKCDVWPVDLAELELHELDARPECATHAMACYIDLLPRSDQQWPAVAKTTASCKIMCDRLRTISQRCCRVDLVIRRAFITTDAPGPSGPMNLGITAYLTACGSSQAQASAVLQAALTAFAGALCGHSTLE